jgi:hypothetical protein
MVPPQQRFQLRASLARDGFLWSFLSSKVARSIFLGVLAIALLVFWRRDEAIFHIEPTQDAQAHLPQSTKGRLHLLIPATSSNADLCKLMLSAQVLGYPTPILINYGGLEDPDDPYKSHLAKVQGFLTYLENLETSTEYAEDLVTIVDGYDIWFQVSVFHAQGSEYRD